MLKLRAILVFHPALWALIVLQGFLIAIWIAIDPRISFTPTDGRQTVIAIAACLLIIAAVEYLVPAERRSKGVERVRIMAVGLIFLIVAFVGIRLLNYLTMTLAFPLADERLASWDRLLGLDWYAYALQLGQYPDLLRYIQLPYLFTIQTLALIFMGLTLFGKIERAKELLTLLFLGALVTISVSGFFPATAAMVHFMDDPLRALYGTNVGVYHMPTLTYLREAQHIGLSFADLPGLATFPSFHTMCGLLVAYSLRDHILTLLLGCIWTGAMLMATPIYGGHYFIDIIAGTVVITALAFAYATAGVSWRVPPRISSQPAA
jgi:hypothetical protein